MATGFVPSGFGRVEWICGDLLTGRIYGRVPLKSTSWSNVMDDSGQMRGTAFTYDDGMARLNVPSIAAEGKCFLGAVYVDPTDTGTILQCGPIWNHDYDDDTGQLTITAAGLWNYWDHRKVIAAAIADGATNIASAGGVSFTGWALGTIAKKILQTIGARTNGLPPIIFQADEAMAADDAHTRTYNGWDLVDAGTALRNLTADANGPEIRFRPIFNPADQRFVQWVMDAGTEAAPLLTNNPDGDWQFDASVPKSPVSAVNVNTDATGMADIAWARGNGSEARTIMGTSQVTTLRDQGFPLLETDVTYSDVEKQPTINGYAVNARKQGAKRLLTLTAKVHQDANPSLARYQVGDYVQIINRDNHPYAALAGQTIRSRIVQRSGDDSSFVSLQLAPVFV